jgi:uncharacterized membrane protein
MATIEKTIEVYAPIRTAYNQWTQFEEFPTFMEGVKDVKQLDDTHLHWVAEIGGVREEWDAEITDQRPDERIAWMSTSGPANSGVVTFQRLDDEMTRIVVEMDWQPEGMRESAGAALGLDERRVEGDLQRFREIIERRGAETGAWRGDV